MCNQDTTTDISCSGIKQKHAVKFDFTEICSFFKSDKSNLFLMQSLFEGKTFVLSLWRGIILLYVINWLTFEELLKINFNKSFTLKFMLTLSLFNICVVLVRFCYVRTVENYSAYILTSIKVLFCSLLLSSFPPRLVLFSFS